MRKCVLMVCALAISTSSMATEWLEYASDGNRTFYYDRASLQPANEGKVKMKDSTKRVDDEMGKLDQYWSQYEYDCNDRKVRKVRVVSNMVFGIFKEEESVKWYEANPNTPNWIKWSIACKKK